MNDAPDLAWRYADFQVVLGIPGACSVSGRTRGEVAGAFGIAALAIGKFRALHAVVHLPTRLVAGFVQTRADARAFVRDLARLGDWSTEDPAALAEFHDPLYALRKRHAVITRVEAGLGEEERK